MKHQLYLLTLSLVLTAATPGSALANIGQVLTRDGQRFAGQIRLGSNMVIIANVAHSYIAQVALTNLQEFRIDSRPSPLFENRFSHPDRNTIDWQPSNIGPAYRSGRVDKVGQQIRLWSSGAQLGGREDAFFFVHTSLAGNADIAAQILQLHPGSDSAKAGLMIRQNLAPDAPNVFLGLTPGQGILQWRLRPRANTAQQPARSLSRWLRLRRQENLILCYSSNNGRDWRMMEQLDLPMEETVQIGLAVSGFDPIRSPSDRRSLYSNTFCSMYDVRVDSSLRFHSFVPRLALSSGSVVSGEIAAANHQSVSYIGPSGLASLPQHQLSRIDFYWLPLSYASGKHFSQQGALLTSGEFFEGQFRGLKNGMATISSVLFGLKQFDVNSEVISIVLNLAEPNLDSTEFEVTTWTGSTWRGGILALDHHGLLLRDTTMGRHHVPYHELKDILRL